MTAPLVEQDVPRSGSGRGRALLPGALAGCLALLTVAVLRGWWPVALDHAVVRHVPGPTSSGVRGALLTAAALVTSVATPYLTGALTLLVAARWSWREGHVAALRATVVPLAAVAVLVPLGKALTHRPGPPDAHLHGLLGYFPSGHTTTALVCAATLAVLAGERHPPWRTRLVLAAGTWTALVAASLVLHRYHWLTDVVAGLLLGSVILLQCKGSRSAASPRQSRT